MENGTHGTSFQERDVSSRFSHLQMINVIGGGNTSLKYAKMQDYHAQIHKKKKL